MDNKDAIDKCDMCKSKQFSSLLFEILNDEMSERYQKHSGDTVPMGIRELYSFIKGKHLF